MCIHVPLAIKWPNAEHYLQLFQTWLYLSSIYQLYLFSSNNTKINAFILFKKSWDSELKQIKPMLSKKLSNKNNSIGLVMEQFKSWNNLSHSKFGTHWSAECIHHPVKFSLVIIKICLLYNINTQQGHV